MIQWSSGRSSFPLRLVDWVEEIQHISSQFGVLFHHILGEANAVADHLAKVGVFGSSVNFYVQFLFLWPKHSLFYDLNH